MLARFTLKEKIVGKNIACFVWLALLASTVYAQPTCSNPINFTIEKTSSTSVRATYQYAPYEVVDAEFRWYKDGVLVKTEPFGHDYARFYSDYSPLSAGASITAQYYNAINNCLSWPSTFTMPIPPPPCTPPSISQTYANICTDGIGRIQFQSSIANTSFTLYRLNGSTYVELTWSSSGYLEIPDFYGQGEYYVRGRVDNCNGSYVKVNFEGAPSGGTTRSVATNQTTNTVTSNTFGATRLEGHSGTVERWEYSFASPTGPYTDWGQAGLTTTSGTCCMGSPGQTIWIRAQVKKGSCPSIASSATSYHWPRIPIVVNAGPDRSSIGGPITFSGSASGGNSALSFQWSQLSGPSILPGGSSGSSLTVNPPNVTANYVFRLTASDAYGQAYDDVALSVINCVDVNHNFTLQRIATGPNCTGAPEAARAVYGPNHSRFSRRGFQVVCERNKCENTTHRPRLWLV